MKNALADGLTEHLRAAKAELIRVGALLSTTQAGMAQETTARTLAEIHDKQTGAELTQLREEFKAVQLALAQATKAATKEAARAVVAETALVNFKKPNPVVKVVPAPARILNSVVRERDGNGRVLVFDTAVEVGSSGDRKLLRTVIRERDANGKVLVFDTRRKE